MSEKSVLRLDKELRKVVTTTCKFLSSLLD